jgi:hypothetical protein
MAKVTEYRTSFTLGTGRDAFHFFPARYNGLTGIACTITQYNPGIQPMAETFWSRTASLPTTDEEVEQVWYGENWTPVEADDRFTAL